jgi:hypothetical protein
MAMCRRQEQFETPVVQFLIERTPVVQFLRKQSSSPPTRRYVTANVILSLIINQGLQENDGIHYQADQTR